MDLKNFGKEDINDFAKRVEEGDLNKDESQTIDDLKEEYGEKFDEMISQYQNMEESELIGEVFKLVNKSKQEGTFNPTKLRNIAESLKPLLNDEQKEKLEQLLLLINI